MVRVLVFGMTENPGGIESVIMNYYRNLDREKVQFDFLCNSYNKIAYEDEVLAMGATTYHITARSVNPIKYRRELSKVFKENADKYDAIWVNVCSLANVDYLKFSKKYGIKKRIIHSHNSQNMDSALRGLLHRYNKRKIDKIATDFWTCAPDAADWFFPQRISDRVVQINNAIDIEKLRFDISKRDEIRKKLGWADKYILGNIGRLHFQKNQTFLIDIFNELCKESDEYRLVLVGQGEDCESLEQKVKELGLVDRVKFAGVQYDIAGYLSAFDLFLFPSLFEGLSVVALEAQANGVPVLASEGVIPKQVRMNDNFIFYKLEEGAKSWKEKVADIRKSLNRENENEIYDNFIKKGFEIKTEVRKLENYLIQ